MEWQRLLKALLTIPPFAPQVLPQRGLVQDRSQPHGQLTIWIFRRLPSERCNAPTLTRTLAYRACQIYTDRYVYLHVGIHVMLCVTTMHIDMCASVVATIHELQHKLLHLVFKRRRGRRWRSRHAPSLCLLIGPYGFEQSTCGRNVQTSNPSEQLNCLWCCDRLRLR